MKSKQLLLKFLSGATFAAAMLFSSSTLFAQVKIGTAPTTMDPNNNLEVQGSTTGRKLSVDKASGKMTYADGTEGANKVLTSDANGVASWITPESQDSPVLLSVNKIGTANQSIPATNPATTTVADLSTKIFDKSNNFNLTTNQFTVPANGAGYYQINGAFVSELKTHVLGAFLYVFVNGGNRRILCVGNTPANSGIAAGGAVVVKLNAGDVIDFRFRATSSDVVISSCDIDIYQISK